MGMILLSAKGREKNTFEVNKDMFLGTLDEDSWREFLSDFNREVDGEITLDDFKEVRRACPDGDGSGGES